METVSGQNNLLLRWRPVPGGAELLQVQTGDAAVSLPETIHGLPVVALGHHALTPDFAPAEGEPLRIACGLGEREPDNRKLERLTLPPMLRRVGDYAFYQCAALRELRLSEPVERWGGSVFMNCRLLDTFSLRARDERAETVAYLADELSRELDVTVTYPDGEQARLIFPEYREDYEENAPAHHFDYAIDGPGYPYHHVFRSRALPLPDFDALFPGLTAMEHDPDCALRLAWHRLRLPKGLSAPAERQYLDYLKSRAGDVLRWLLAERDNRGLTWFLPRCCADGAVLARAAETARRLGAAEPLAMLLEQQHRQFGLGSDRTFDL